MKFADHEKTAKEYKIGGKGFWTPEPGENKLRVLSGYEAYGNHWVVADNRSYVCLGKDNGCVYCENEKDKDCKTSRRSVKFLMWVLDRADGEVKIAQVGYSIIKQLGTLATSEDWAFDDIPPYDVVIKKTGEKLKTEYNVTPTKAEKPLTVDEQKVVDEEITDLSEVIEKMKTKVANPDETPF